MGLTQAISAWLMLMLSCPLCGPCSAEAFLLSECLMSLESRCVCARKAPEQEGRGQWWYPRLMMEDNQVLVCEEQPPGVMKSKKQRQMRREEP